MLSRAVSNLQNFVSRIKLDVVKLGTYVSLIGGVFSIIAVLFGSGFALEPFFNPEVIVQIQPQLVSSSTVLNSCLISNEGRNTARNLVIQLYSDEDVLFEELDISGAEGQWEIEQGGQNTDNAIISLERLVSTHILVLTVRTNVSIDFDCTVASEDGPANMSPEILNLQWLFVGQGILLFTLIFILYQTKFRYVNLPNAND